MPLISMVIAFGLAQPISLAATATSPKVTAVAFEKNSEQAAKLGPPAL